MGDNGILTKATEASEKTEERNAYEQVQIAVTGSIGTDGVLNNEELEKNLNQIENISGVPSPIEDTDYPFTVTVDQKYSYTINKDGFIEEKEFKPQVESVRIVNEEGEEQEEASQEKGTKLYIEMIVEMDGGTIKEVTSEQGNVTEENGIYKMDIYQNGKYVFHIIGIRESNEYSIDYTVTVNQYESSLKIGDYVKYDVTYTDMYTKYEFTNETGWRVLDSGVENGDGTYTGVKLVSTGIPTMLNTSLSDIENKEYDGTIGNWAGNKEQREKYISQFEKTNSSDEDTIYASAGLTFNFGKIKFNSGANEGDNEGYYTKINNKENGLLNETEFLKNGAIEVHNLTLADINKARGESDINSTNDIYRNPGASGLFYLLDGLEDFGYNFMNVAPVYWVSSPFGYGVMVVNSTGDITSAVPNHTVGIRTVVSLPDNFKIEEVEK